MTGGTGGIGGPPVDPGLQAPRTALAWQRTGLTLVGNAVLIAVIGVRLGSVPLALTGALLGALVAALAVRGFPAVPRVPAATVAARTGQSRAPWPTLVLVGGTAVVLGLAGAAAGVLALVRPN